MSVTVDDKIMKEILNEAGFPILAYEDVGITADDAKDLFLWPAMRQYFSFYPRKTKMSIPVNGPVNVAFPDDLVYGVSSARVAVQSFGGSQTRYNPLHNYSYTRAVGSTGRRGDPYITQELRIAEEMASTSLISLRKAGSFDIDTENRKITGYSNVSGELIITWAAYSENFASIKFEHQDSVIKLARAYALRFFGMLRNQQDPNTGVSLNGEMFINRADQIEDKITERWQNATKVVVMH